MAHTLCSPYVLARCGAFAHWACSRRVPSRDAAATVGASFAVGPHHERPLHARISRLTYVCAHVAQGSSSSGPLPGVESDDLEDGNVRFLLAARRPRA